MTNSPFTTQQVDGAIRARLREYRRLRLPTEEAQRKNATYRGNLSHYRSVAQKCLNEGDYLQAAEKSWGTYAQAIKSAGAAYGVHVNTHSAVLSVSQALTDLVATTDEPIAVRLDTGFHKARSLHQHFYENDLADSAVERAIADVMDAVGLLQTLFERN